MLDNGRFSHTVSLSTSHPRAGNFTARARELRELIVTRTEVPAVEARLLRNGSELEHSTVRNVVTHLEFLLEAGIRQARAHPLSLGRHSETFQVECPPFGQVMLDQAQKPAPGSSSRHGRTSW